MPNIEWLNWPVPHSVKACYSLRTGGKSQPPYHSFNLAHHVGDCNRDVIANRQQLASIIGQDTILWLHQVHDTEVCCADLLTEPLSTVELQADASYSRQRHRVCCVMTADCLPVFFCDQHGKQVAVAHAGWRGLLNGILEKTLATFDVAATTFIYLGPAISQSAFVVGNDVRLAFLKKNPAFDAHFIVAPRHAENTNVTAKWLMDLYGIAKEILTNQGVNAIYGGTHCTYRESDSFFSFRRDGQTGRMASLIWLE